jgi:biopolymer transport protein ExbD
MHADDALIDRIDLMPLAGALLALVSILILAFPFQTHESRVDVGGADYWGPSTPAVTVTVTFDGHVLWDGRPVSDAEFDQRLTQAAHLQASPEIDIRGDRLVRYDAVARVLTAIKRHGLTHVGFVGVEQFF